MNNLVQKSKSSSWQDITFCNEQIFFHLRHELFELLKPRGKVYLDPGYGWVRQKGNKRGGTLIHHWNVLRHFPIRTCQVGWAHYYIIIMVSSLSFIRVIAAICHIERNVPVDKYLYAYKPQEVRQHNLFVWSSLYYFLLCSNLNIWLWISSS